MVHHKRMKLNRRPAETEKDVKAAETPFFKIEGFRPLVLLFAVFFLVFFTPNLTSTDVQNYHLVRSLVFDGDFQCFNEISLFENQYCARGVEEGEPFPGPLGYTPVTASVGYVFSTLPFLAIVRALVLGIGTMAELTPDTGYEMLYRFATLFMSIILGFLAMFIMVTSSRRFGSSFSALMTVGSFVFATPMFMSTFITPANGHAITLFWVSLTFYLILELYLGKRQRTVVLTMLAGSAMAMSIACDTRLMPLIVLSLLLPGRGKSLLRSFREIQLSLVFFFCGFLITLLPSLILHRVMFGTFFTIDVSGDASNLLQVLFHPRLGIFYQFPVILLALISLKSLFAFDKRLFLLLFFVTGIHFVIIAMGGSIEEDGFGYPAIITILPFLSGTMTLQLDTWRKRGKMPDLFLIVCLLLLIFWTIFQLGAFSSIGAERISELRSSEYNLRVIFNSVSNVSSLGQETFFQNYLGWRGSAYAGTFFSLLFLTLLIIIGMFWYEAVVYKRKYVVKSGWLLYPILILSVSLSVFVLFAHSRSEKWFDVPIAECSFSAQHGYSLYTPWSGFSGGRNFLQVSDSGQYLHSLFSEKQKAAPFARPELVKSQTPCQTNLEITLDNPIKTDMVLVTTGKLGQHDKAVLVLVTEKGEIHIQLKERPLHTIDSSLDGEGTARFTYSLKLYEPEIIKAISVLNSVTDGEVEIVKPLFIYGVSLRIVEKG